MRAFATWCTGHRKTVIVGWVVALIATGMIAGSVGSAYTEEFKLPASDSTKALELLEHKFRAQSGEVATIVYKDESGVESPAVKRKMEGVFDEVAKFPHVSEVASPYSGNGAAAVSDNGKIAYATIQFDVTNDKIDKDKTKEIIKVAQGAAGDGLQVELGAQPIEEARAQEEESDSSFGIGLL